MAPPEAPRSLRGEGGVRGGKRSEPRLRGDRIVLHLNIPIVDFIGIHNMRHIRKISNPANRDYERVKGEAERIRERYK